MIMPYSLRSIGSGPLPDGPDLRKQLKITYRSIIYSFYFMSFYHITAGKVKISYFWISLGIRYYSTLDSSWDIEFLPYTPGQCFMAGEIGKPRPLYVYPAHFCLLPPCQDKILKLCLQALETKSGNYAIGDQKQVYLGNSLSDTKMPSETWLNQ